MKAVDILAEIEDIIRNQPPYATLKHNTAENLSWLGRVVGALEAWNPAKAILAAGHVREFHSLMATDSLRGYLALMILLNAARTQLRMTTLGPVNAAIGSGLVFDYFDEIRKQIETAKTDLLFVDPYLDAEFIGRYLPHVPAGVAIRLLAREKIPTLIPAAKLFAAQTQANIAVRSAPRFHDRYVIIDGTSCFQSGASFKDGGRTAPTTITQITDAFAAVRQTYEDLWNSARQEL